MTNPAVANPAVTNPAVANPAVAKRGLLPVRLGLIGEDFAESYLLNNGYEILARNWRFRRRELDIVALAPGGSPQGNPRAGSSPTVIFVEVKSRALSAHGKRHLFDTINGKKRMHLRMLACTFLAKHRRQLQPLAASWPPPFRIDVIGIIFVPGEVGEPPRVLTLEHLKAAV